MVLSDADLSPVERAVRDAFPTGQSVDLRTGQPEEDDPSSGAQWPAERTVRAEILAALLLDGQVTQDGVVPALHLVGARITGTLDLAEGLVQYPLRLEGCWIEEAPNLRSASTRSLHFTGCRLPGISAELLRVEGHLLVDRTTVDGPMVLTRAHITGELRMSGTTISAPSGSWAIWAGGLTMEGGVFCRRGFTASGGIRLVGAQLAGGLFMEGAQLSNPGADTISGDGLNASSIILSDGFTTDGTVRLNGAHIVNLLSFDLARLDCDSTALDGSRMQAGELRFTPAGRPTASVDLSSATVDVLRDNDDSWPQVVHLDGFTYGSIQTTPGETSADRLLWLDRMPAYSPQPYEQLAAWYRRVGHDDDARRVLLKKQRRRRRSQRLLGKLWGYLLDGTVGYGYRPWIAGLWLIALTAISSILFNAGHPIRNKPGEGPPFQALIYTLDLLIPIGDLGQRGVWYFTGSLKWLAYALTAAGWILTSAVVAGVTRSLNKS
ncbi:oxidoreductase [Streptomyces sp. NPDC007264]|uniref:oxidoreductase n=1 Tax=Streptomyces sp. NPDC007264 TaxID=3364777 RepID=UPI0036DB742A